MCRQCAGCIRCHYTSKNKGDMTNKEILELPVVQDHERLKKEYCKMWRQQEKLLKSHALLIEMLAERNSRISKMEEELARMRQ